jgi:release factor glutamine methyltransferase
VAGEAPELTYAAIVGRLRAAGCVFAEEEARLLAGSAPTQAGLAAMVDRRAAGVPLEHVLGWAEFCGLRIAVDPGVFVPRRRTECLVREAVSLARRGPGRAGPVISDPGSGSGRPGSGSGRPGSGSGRPGSGIGGHGSAVDHPGQASGQPPIVVVDLCCGSGAVGAALAAELGNVELYAADVDPAAVACARRNLRTDAGTPPGSGLAGHEARCRARVYQGDLYDALPSGLRGQVRILTANVPYVPTQEVAMLPPEAREHEPLAAVDGGPDGLDVLRRVAAGARSWLAPGGHLLVETSDRQASRAAEAFARAGLAARIAGCADLDATVVIGERAAVPRA